MLSKREIETTGKLKTCKVDAYRKAKTIKVEPMLLWTPSETGVLMTVYDIVL